MSLTVNLSPVIELTPGKFEKIAASNRDLRLELTSDRKLLIMPPTAGEKRNRNFELYLDLGIWNRQNNLGKAFDSSTGFKLPNGAIRSPDVSWIELKKWQQLTQEERKKYLPICPDFAIELLSENDDLQETQVKIQEYLANGLSLGWLIDPFNKVVEIYRAEQTVEKIQSPISLSGENILPGFILNLQTIWQDN